jgi:GT2 family glycosyltransferase/glycosyltransferase involved in cell wall biosynthesis
VNPGRKLFRDLPRRGYLTIKHLGFGTFLFRLVTFPLRITRLERDLRLRRIERFHLREALRWYKRHGRPVTIVVPTYGPPDVTAKTVKRLRRTVDRSRTRIVVVDDGSAAEHQSDLRKLRGVELELSPANAGYAASVNKGIRMAREDDDVIVMNSDVLAHRHWLEQLQYAAYSQDRAGIVGPRLLYPDDRIQSAGTYRNEDQPEWFDHRYRFKPRRHGPALVQWDALAVTGACMYVRREVVNEVGEMDDAYRMGYEDVDWCLKAWEAGWRTLYEPGASLTHLESVTRGMEVGERERSSQQRFWSRWGERFDSREVRTPEGALRVVYVTEGTGVGGGHRDVFEHVNRLRQRGHEVELYSLEGQPDWFPLEADVREFERYDDLVRALEDVEAIKIATWWKTARPVWRASVLKGVGVFFVQDIETSYYGDDERTQFHVLAGYREEFRYMTISNWNRARLAEMGRDSELVPPGIDLETFRPLEGVERRGDVLLAIGRTNPLKNLPLTYKGWRRLDPRPELWLFGVEPQVARDGARYIESPGDAEVNELLNQATAFVQTSSHEGFALPPLEAMAAGTPVVCTDAHGNRDFCRDGDNCLMADHTPESVGAALERLFRDGELRARLAAGGRRTAQDYGWERRVDQLERFLTSVAAEAAAPPKAMPDVPAGNRR